jgi:hypothetical protein
MREIVENFWDGGGGGLDITVGASDEVLATICCYMHTGMVLFPRRIARQMELIRVSIELGVHSLYAVACEHLMRNLTRQAVPIVLAFADEYELDDLHNQCELFAKQGRCDVVPITFLHQDNLTSSPLIQHAAVPSARIVAGASESAGSISTASTRSSAPNLSALDNNHKLRDAIVASLNDVSAVLGSATDSSSVMVGTSAKSRTVVPQVPQHVVAQSRRPNSDSDLDALTGGPNDQQYPEIEDITRSDYVSDAVTSRALNVGAASSGGSTRSTAAAATKKPKSGGIYGLLLAADQQQLQQTDQRYPTVTAEGPSSMPGRVMSDRKQSAGGFGASLAPSSSLSTQPHAAVAGNGSKLPVPAPKKPVAAGVRVAQPTIEVSNSISTAAKAAALSMNPKSTGGGLPQYEQMEKYPNLYAPTATIYADEEGDGDFVEYDYGVVSTTSRGESIDSGGSEHKNKNPGVTAASSRTLQSASQSKQSSATTTRLSSSGNGKAGSTATASGNATEFSKQMSLLPEREMTESEKR